MMTGKTVFVVCILFALAHTVSAAGAECRPVDVVTCQVEPDTSPVMTASPEQINIGLTDALDVNCSISVVEGSKVAALISLTVFRNTSQTGWTELAIISDFSHGQINEMTTENLTVSGWFKSDESASLSLHWDYPSDQQAGKYICTAVGIDSLGHTLEMSTQVHMSEQCPAFADWKDKIIQVDKSVKEMDILVQGNKDFVKTLDEKIIQLYKISLFEAPFNHKNRGYYLYRFAYNNNENAQAICITTGGYLAEIDDRDEYVAIQNFLKSTKGVHGVYIAGSDEGHEGRWTLPSGDLLPFTDWELTNRGIGRNCVHLWHPNFRMHDAHCVLTNPSLEYRFLCEVPLV